MDSLKLLYVILCVVCILQSWTLSMHLSSNQDKEKRGSQHLQEVSLDIGSFVMEGSGGGDIPPTQVVLDLQATGLDRKLLGLPAWEYLIVGLVVFFATFIGGSVVIGCKKCSGVFGSRSDKDTDY
uniref:Uncharacterized protein n=2 Tax=Magallana gigas TaxID=29159 RepID=A0A8W8I270_MAGGI|nr:uncharacterized protein LOC117689283 [Crassostrea gigas]